MLLQACRRFTESRLGKVCRVFIMLLCVCITIQMLGVSATLLDPAKTFDALGASVLEGFSLPPSLPLLSPSSQSVPLADRLPLIHVPLLASALFHPPLS